MLLDAHTADEQLDPAAPLAMLLEHFDLIVQTPADVDKLDAAILQLAVEGKLVAQDPSDEPVSILLKQIEAEKKLLYADKMKAKIKVSLVDRDDEPFSIPPSWSWVRLGDVTNYEESARATSNDVMEGTWVLELADIEKSTSNLLGKERYPERTFQSDKNVFRRGDVLYGKLRPYLDKVLIADEDGVCTTEIVPMRGYFGIEPAYLRWTLKSPYFITQANSKTYGMNLPRLGTKDAVRIPIPLPPLAEQKRIVARVDELRRHTAALRAELAAAAQDAVTVNNAALNRLHTAEHADTFAAAWQTLGDAFDPLYSVPQNLTALRQTILQLAVQGKLLAQDPSDEPASALVQWVMSEKLRLQKEGVTAEIEHGRRVQPSEALFPLPLGWTWQRLVDVSLVEMGQSPPGDSYNEVGEGVPLVNGPVEFSAGPFGLTVKTKFTTKPTKVCQEGDLLVCVRGSTTGRTNVAAFDACIGRGVAAVRALVDRKFLNYVILSKRQEIYDAGKGSTFPSISKRQLQDIVIGIPPLAEQERIVAKVDELLALCDVLEAELAEAEAVRVRLVDAILAGV